MIRIDMSDVFTLIMPMWRRWGCLYGRDDDNSFVELNRIKVVAWSTRSIQAREARRRGSWETWAPCR